jgi:hypothetical protein
MQSDAVSHKPSPLFCKDTILFPNTKLLVVICLKTRTFAVSQTIIDLDARLKKLNASKLTKHISWRKADFMEGPMNECYVVSMKRE